MQQNQRIVKRMGYYSVVDEKAFMEKMKEWHVELEDNKPEEIPPWKEQI